MSSQSLTLLSVVLVIWSLALRGTREQGESPPCVQKLVPCRPYLKGGAPPPPPTCCAPLKELLAGDYRCLCTILDNDVLLRSFNLTREDALQLPKKCGTDADLDKCNNDGASAPPPPPSPVSSPSPPPPSEESPKSAVAPLTKIFTSLGAAITVVWTFMASPLV